LIGTNIYKISASQNIVEENVLDLPTIECSDGIAVCSSPILEHMDSNIEIIYVSSNSRVACTSPITGKKKLYT